MATTAEIFNVQRFSTHDGPGIRTTVFLKGCPLSCWWCHNPESQRFHTEVLYYPERCRHCGDCIAICPRENIHDAGGILQTGDNCAHCGACADACVAEARRRAGRTVSVPELLAEVEKDLLFFDESGGGVTLSGGEPASRTAFSVEFLNACRGRGIHTAIETCGLAPLDAFLRLATAADLVFFDLKFIDSDAHQRYSGVTNHLILRNLQAIVADGIRPVIRIPVLPGLNDSDAEIARFVEYLATLPKLTIELLPFHRIGAEKYARLGRPYRADGLHEPSPREMARFQAALAGAPGHTILCSAQS
jgi:pyruvate formate lyase activating enzyme